MDGVTESYLGGLCRVILVHCPAVHGLLYFLTLYRHYLAPALVCST